MKMKSPLLALITASLFGFVGGCGPSKADLHKVEKELKEVTAERDELKVKLEKTLGPLETVQRENVDLRAKVEAAAAERAAEAKASSSPSKKKAAGKKKKSKKKKAKK